MNGKFYGPHNYKPDHSAFGGLVCLADFNTEHRKDNIKSGSAIASRIEADLTHDRNPGRRTAINGRFA